MAATDLLFTEGETLNFILEVPSAVVSAPLDILTESGSNPSCVCNEIPTLVVASGSPETILLSDGKLAKRATDTFYIKM